MNRKMVMLAGLTALGLTGAASAQAADFHFQDDAMEAQVERFSVRDRHEDRWDRRDGRFDHRRDDRYYGRPVPERRHWDRPIVARPGWGWGDDCRIIIKRRINHWGAVRVTRTRICT